MQAPIAISEPLEILPLSPEHDIPREPRFAGDTYRPYAYGEGTGITTHAYRRFRRRFMKLPRERVEEILDQFKRKAGVDTGIAYFRWNNDVIGLVLRDGVVLTVMTGPSSMFSRPTERRKPWEYRQA